MALGAHPEASLRQRTGEAFEHKHAIVRWAASVIQPGENILAEFSWAQPASEDPNAATFGDPLIVCHYV